MFDQHIDEIYLFKATLQTIYTWDAVCVKDEHRWAVRHQYFFTISPTDVLVVDTPLDIPVLEHDISSNAPISCSSKTNLHSWGRQQYIRQQPMSV